MGCNQSTERKGAAAPAAEPQPVEVVERSAAAVATEVAVAEAASPQRPTASTEAEPQPIVASHDEPTIEAAQENVTQPSFNAIPEAPLEPVESRPSAAEPVQEEPAHGEAEEAVAVAQPAQMATPVIPALALPRKRNSMLTKRTVASRASSKNSRATPRAQKENVASAKPKTPSNTQSVKRGLSMSASTNQQTADGSAQKKVFFDAIPAQEDAATKRKNKAKKAAGKHGCNVNEELFLASIAAFERQLTHRASLNSQLNSR